MTNLYYNLFRELLDVHFPKHLYDYYSPCDYGSYKQLVPGTLIQFFPTDSSDGIHKMEFSIADEANTVGAIINKANIDKENID